MKTTIYFFSFDTQQGMDSPLFTSREDLAAEILQTVENYNEQLAQDMRAFGFETPGWCQAWEAFKDNESCCQNYFNYGEQELELPDNPQMVEALNLCAGLIKTARPRFPKSIRHPDRFQLEQTCAAINSALTKP